MNIPTPSPLPVLAAAAMSSLGIELMLAQAPAGSDQFSTLAQLGGSAALIVAMGIALRYMRSREEKAVEQTEKGHQKVIALLTEDRDQWREHARALESRIMGERFCIQGGTCVKEAVTRRKEEAGNS